MKSDTIENTICISLNGERAEVSGAPLAELLERLGYDLTWAAVAVNESLVFRQDLGDYRLRDGDRVEVVSPMSGG